ncbi:iron ABC transporter substrate-binding protein [Xanthobacter oligotrophicus]|uniref:Iron ABC transporter substrate-binding protein n=1 Tax=Xanthobacter oligotrophicus TaxID=2607286 RepID=A0ABW6ZRZ4_9HYPH
MTVTTTSGTKIYIGPAVTAAAADTTAEFAALTYVEVGEVQNLGEFGDESSSVSFASIGDARTRKLKGARDAGTLALTVGRDPLDVGQIALKAAEKTKFEYAIKVVAADAPSAGHTNSIFYFRALVMSGRNNFGANDSVTTAVFNLGINSEVYEVPSAVTP